MSGDVVVSYKLLLLLVLAGPQNWEPHSGTWNMEHGAFDCVVLLKTNDSLTN